MNQLTKGSPSSWTSLSANLYEQGFIVVAGGDDAGCNVVGKLLISREKCGGGGGGDRSSRLRERAGGKPDPGKMETQVTHRHDAMVAVAQKHVLGDGLAFTSQTH